MDPMESNKKKEWKFQNASEKTIGIHDAIHGPILIHHPIAKIVDTPAFQRLRFIKQLGLCQYVFPSAQHDRFTHSLGVYHLALEVVRNLADKDENDSLGITSTDKLCVAIAGLLHDLGHGPFSHFYDGLFLKNMCVQGFVHEQMSCKIFDYIYEEEPGLRATLDEYLDETDRIFIKELIDTPKNLVDSKGEWVPKGRPREKAFLFQIVNDPISGFDVDKIDYLLRDSKMANVSIRLSKDNWSHVINSMRVEVPKDSKFPQIIFENKREIMVEDVFEERLRLHKTVYRHKSTLAMEIAMCEVLMKANEHLKFEGSDGEFYKMTEAFNNVVAFLKMDDHIIKMIQIGADKNPDIVEAKKLLVKIQRRELPKLAYRLDLKPSMESDMKRTKHQIESDLKQKLQDLKQSDLTSHIFVRLVAFHQGRGVNKSALENVRFNSTVENEGKNSGGSLHAFIYVSYEKRELKDEVLKAIKCLRQTGERPKYLKESLKSEGIGKDVKDVSEGRGKKRTLQESNECNQPTLTEEAQNNSSELSSSFEDVNEGGGMEN